MNARGFPIIQAARITAVKNSNSIGSDDVIDCTIKANYPHDSGHVPGTVNAVSTIFCTAPVTSLSIETSLDLGPVQVASGSNSNGGSAFIQTNAATTCVPGEYDNIAHGDIVFPPGYEPPTATINASSGYQPVACL